MRKKILIPALVVFCTLLSACSNTSNTDTSSNTINETTESNDTSIDTEVITEEPDNSNALLIGVDGVLIVDEYWVSISSIEGYETQYICAENKTSWASSAVINKDGSEYATLLPYQSYNLDNEQYSYEELRVNDDLYV